MDIVTLARAVKRGVCYLGGKRYTVGIYLSGNSQVGRLTDANGRVRFLPLNYPVAIRRAG